LLLKIVEEEGTRTLAPTYQICFAMSF